MEAYIFWISEAHKSFLEVVLYQNIQYKLISF